MVNTVMSLWIICLVATLGLHVVYCSITIPYQTISGTSSIATNIDNRLTCEVQRHHLILCVDECYAMNQNGGNCLGILKDNTITCHLCRPSNLTGIESGLHTNMIATHTLYLFNINLHIPDIYITMDDYNVTTGVISGIGVSGVESVGAGITSNDLIPGGKVGQAIYLHDGGRLYPRVSQPSCLCGPDYCNGKISLTFWWIARGDISAYQEIFISGNQDVALELMVSIWTSKIGGKYTKDGIKRQAGYDREITFDQWTHVSFVVDTSKGVSLYINGILHSFSDGTSAGDSIHNMACDYFILGDRNNIGYPGPANGELDEFKLYYRALSAADIWMEYMAYEGLDTELVERTFKMDLDCNN